MAWHVLLALANSLHMWDIKLMQKKSNQTHHIKHSEKCPIVFRRQLTFIGTPPRKEEYYVYSLKAVEILPRYKVRSLPL
jgi:hypothetical protein